MTDRVAALRRQLQERELPAILLTERENMGYLTGFSGSNAAVILTPVQDRFLTDSRYTVQAAEECPAFAVRTCASSAGMIDMIAEQLKELGITRLAFESDHVTVADHAKWRE